MLVGIFLIGAALLFIGGIVALEVALLESRRAFLPQGRLQCTEGAKPDGLSEESSVPVADFVVASRLTTVFLLVVVGSLAHYPLAGVRAALLRAVDLADGLSVVNLITFCIFELALGAAVLSIAYLIPGFVGTRFRDLVIERLSPIGRALVRLTWPGIATVRLMRQAGVKRDGGTAFEEEALEEDIRSLVEEGERAGVIEEEEREMITRVFRLGDKPIASLMTPRSDVIFLEVGMTIAQAVDCVVESRLTWFPVRQEIDDEVIGIVSVHDVFELQRKYANDSIARLKESSSPAMDVPESMTALELLERFKELGEHFAVVRDEYGSVAGIATVSDVLKVVVGDMDEANGEDRSITARDDGSLLVDASLDVQNLFETLGVTAQSENDRGQFHSVGGFVMTSLGHIPKPGDAFLRDGHRFEVVDMDGKRIDKILVARVAAGQRVVGG